MINIVIYITLSVISMIMFVNCANENIQTTAPDDKLQKLNGKWAAYMSIFDSDHDITSYNFADFSKDGLIIFKTCRRSKDLFVTISSGKIPFELKEKSIIFKKNINLKWPYRIKDNKVEYPKNFEDIKNFPIDKDTLFCELNWDDGEWQYKIATEGDSDILEIFKKTDWGSMIMGSFRREKSNQ